MLLPLHLRAHFFYTVLCNAPDYLISRLLRIEKRAFRIIGSSNFSSVIDVGFKTCGRLMNVIGKHDDHLLRFMFVERDFERFGHNVLSVLL